MKYRVVVRLSSRTWARIRAAKNPQREYTLILCDKINEARGRNIRSSDPDWHAKDEVLGVSHDLAVKALPNLR